MNAGASVPLQSQEEASPTRNNSSPSFPHYSFPYTSKIQLWDLASAVTSPSEARPQTHFTHIGLSKRISWQHFSRLRALQMTVYC